jgi:hypothetical protein
MGHLNYLITLGHAFPGFLLHLCSSTFGMIQSITLLGGSTPPQTESPPDSPSLPAAQQLRSEYAERFAELVEDIATAAQRRNTSTTKKVPTVPPSPPTDSVATVARMRASKLEYRKVQEV